MASVGPAQSLKRRDQPVSTNREADRLTVTPLGAGNEVGRSCVYMSFKGKTVLVRHLLHSSLPTWELQLLSVLAMFAPFSSSVDFYAFGSSIVGFILHTRAWLLFLTLMRLTLPPLTSFSSLSTSFLLFLDE